MGNSQRHGVGRRSSETRLLNTLERLLQLDATNVRETLNAAAQLVGETLNAEKADVFLYHPENRTLQVAGLSDTSMAKHEVALGLDQMPIADGGRLVEVFQTGMPYVTGHADQDPLLRRGIPEGLGVHSLIAVVLEVRGERRGLLQAASTREEAFSEQDRAFLPAVATWVGLLLHRAELVEQLTAAAAEEGRRVAADELINVLAHDLRNLLSPISLRLQLLLRRFNREQRASDSNEVQQVLASVERLHSLIRNLLDAARLERGLFTIEVQDCDLTTLVRETAALLRTESTPIAVRAPESMIVRADQERMQQAIENMLENALQHSPFDTPVTVSLEVERQAESGKAEGAHDWAVLTIQDQGEGIPPELMPRIFERYVRGRESRGMGLGLYVASRIVEAHGGTLTADSPVGQGARFTLRLPLVSDRAKEKEKEKEQGM